MSKEIHGPSLISEELVGHQPDGSGITTCTHRTRPTRHLDAEAVLGKITDLRP